MNQFDTRHAVFSVAINACGKGMSRPLSIIDRPGTHWLACFTTGSGGKLYSSGTMGDSPYWNES